MTLALPSFDCERNLDVDALRELAIDIRPGYRARSRWRWCCRASAATSISPSERNLDGVVRGNVAYEIRLALHRYEPRPDPGGVPPAKQTSA